MEYATVADSCALCVFAKWPAPGHAKTRLIPLLGMQGAAEVARLLLLQTLGWAYEAQRTTGLQTVVWTNGGTHAQWDTLLAPFGLSHRPQQGSDLGQKMDCAIRESLLSHANALIVGTDTPTLSAQHVHAAWCTLDTHDCTFIPALDGGYVLVGMKAVHSAVFENIEWGTERVAEQTRSRLQAAGLSAHWAAPEPDLDTPQDLIEARQRGWISF